MLLGLLPLLLGFLDVGGGSPNRPGDVAPGSNAGKDEPLEADDDGTNDGNGDENDDGEEEVRDPAAKIKSLQEANSRLSKKLRAKDERIAELEGNQPAESELTAARLEAAFFRSIATGEPRISDVETAWDLATAKGFFDTVKIGDDGVEGMPEALERLVGRYPYLADEDVPIDDEEPPGYGGRPVTAPSKGSSTTSAANLRERFPALRKRGRR